MCSRPVFLLWGWLIAFVATTQAEYTKIQSKYSKDNSIRVKEFADGELCNGGTKHYTGWADVGDHHMFFWLHPARYNKISDAPLLVWLQGGPGGSSIVGMLVEHGPCRIELDNLTPQYNQFSWTESFNVLYLDQPAGVGFSYVDEHEDPEKYPSRTEESALDFIATLKLIQEAFPELASSPLHIAGESYAGRYVPEYGAAILEYNTHVAAAAKLPLVSIMVGNGLTSFKEQVPASYDTGCFTHNGIAPIFNETECETMSLGIDRCETLIEKCDQTPDPLVCNAAGRYCREVLWELMDSKLINQYDRIMVCPAVHQCYPVFDLVLNWLNSPDVRTALEIHNQTRGKVSRFEVENQIISKRYESSADFYTSSIPALQRVLNDPKAAVLYYVGVRDWACNSIGVSRMLDNASWKWHAKFRGTAKVTLPWKTIEGDEGGQMRGVDGLWHVELNGGGHLIPYDQPRSALLMVQNWLKAVESNTTGLGRDALTHSVRDHESADGSNLRAGQQPIRDL